MTSNKHDKQKRAWGGAIKRTKPSEAAVIIDREIRSRIELGFCPSEPRILDYGCGHGFDANHFGWDAYDPYYGPFKVAGKTHSYDFVVCINVINALSRNNRHRVLESLNYWLKTKRGQKHWPATAFLAVPRNIPETGKLGIHHSLQNYVVLKGLPELITASETDNKFIIYQMERNAAFKDKTKEFLTARDKRARK